VCGQEDGGRVLSKSKKGPKHTVGSNELALRLPSPQGRRVVILPGDKTRTSHCHPTALVLHVGGLRYFKLYGYTVRPL
jgi:hypothetical protein